VTSVLLLTKVGGGDPHSGELALTHLSAWTPDDLGAPLDVHLAALSSPDLPAHDLICVAW
jgi:hypothetical protein